MESSPIPSCTHQMSGALCSVASTCLPCAPLHLMVLAGPYTDLLSSVAQWAKRYDSLRYSAQFADVCRYLEEAEEYPSDRYLVYLVRLQCIVQRIERKVPIDDFTADTMIPIAMFVKALHGELNDFKKSLPADLADHRKYEAQS